MGEAARLFIYRSTRELLRRAVADLFHIRTRDVLSSQYNLFQNIIYNTFTNSKVY